jgi:hypothetical protein
MVIPIADMTVATMEAVILQSMTSTRKPQREAMHILLELRKKLVCELGAVSGVRGAGMTNKLWGILYV